MRMTASIVSFFSSSASARIAATTGRVFATTSRSRATSRACASLNGLLRHRSSCCSYRSKKSTSAPKTAWMRAIVASSRRCGSLRASCRVSRCSCALAQPSSITWATMGKALIGCQLGDIGPELNPTASGAKSSSSDPSPRERLARLQSRQRGPSDREASASDPSNLCLPRRGASSFASRGGG